MWFLFGGVALLLTILAGFHARMFLRSGGDRSILGGRPAWIQALRYKREPNGFVLGVECPPGFAFSLHDEGALDRWFRSIGVNAERQVGDVAFDRRLFIESDDDRVPGVLRDAPALRDEIIAWRDHFKGSSVVAWHARGGRLWIEVRGRDIVLGDLGPSLAATLHVFSDALAQRAHQPGRDRFRWRAALVLATNTAIGVFGGVLALGLWALPDVMLQPGRTFAISLLLSVPATCAFALAAIAWFGSSARAHRVLAEVLTVGLAGFVGLGWWGLREANNTLDASPVEWQLHARASTTVHTYSCGGRRSSTCRAYYLNLPDGLHGPPPNLTRIELTQSQHGALPEFGAVEVGIGRGRFGLRWVAGVRKPQE